MWTFQWLQLYSVHSTQWSISLCSNFKHFTSTAGLKCMYSKVIMQTHIKSIHFPCYHCTIWRCWKHQLCSRNNTQCFHSVYREDTVKACSHWIRIQTGSVTELPNANSIQIQCASITHGSHCIVQNRIHACTLTSSGHTSTQLPWHPHHIFTSASHHFASRVEQIRGTQCVARRSVLTVSSRHECECQAFLVLKRNCAIQINLDQKHLWKWIGINPDRIWIGRMRIQCERA